MENIIMDEDVDISQPKEISQETADAVSAMAQEFPNRGEVATIALQAMPQSIAQMDDSDRIEDGETSAGNVLMRSTRAFWGKVASSINNLVGSFKFKGGDYIGVTPSTNATTGEHTILIENKGVTEITATVPDPSGTLKTGGLIISPEKGNAVAAIDPYVQNGASGHYPNIKYNFVEFAVQKSKYTGSPWFTDVDGLIEDEYMKDAYWNEDDTAFLVGSFVTVDAKGNNLVRTRNIPISRAASPSGGVVTKVSSGSSNVHVSPEQGNVVVSVDYGHPAAYTGPGTIVGEVLWDGATLWQQKQTLHFTNGLLGGIDQAVWYEITTAEACS